MDLYWDFNACHLVLEFSEDKWALLFCLYMDFSWQVMRGSWIPQINPWALSLPIVVLMSGLVMCVGHAGVMAIYLYQRKISASFFQKFWDWSWQEYALYDLQEMIRYVYTVTNSRVFVIGYSQGTIISLAAFTEPDTVQMVGAAALLCPITYLNHMTARLPLRLVKMHLTQVLLAVGIHELNFKSDWGTRIMEMMCDRHVDCGDLLSSITGKNCCFNSSRIDFYLEYEPHPSSTKNLNHLFQMIRKGTFAKYDYGFWKNLKHYGQLKPPKFDLSQIPSSLPLWMGYGGNDALADVTDLQHTLKELQSKPDLLYLENYGHLDFLLSTRAKEDVYDKMLAFFDSLGTHSSY
ncbi:triacylglycerol lipase 1-like isoform X3 [Olea europaea var. sylvestris]|nr:triacylglycerol lipase 1-like isoform X3 [Olea europaea var. sylvestris]